MKKSKIELDNQQIERVVSMAQEERKPFEAIKEEFNISENEVTEILRKQLSKDQFEAWLKKITSSKAKLKPQKSTNFQDDDDLDSKYYLKNKFD